LLRFTKLYPREYQLIKANPKANTYLACGVLVRGDMQVSDINRNIKRMQSGLQWPTGTKRASRFVCRTFVFCATSLGRCLAR
jgi:hypothetical protein